ncbi:MAG: NADH-quinone oxidoreductase subunit J [Chthonomonadaceae bacterium]|nr:NADH-quinone oxidoreductase subunit J [Chthonomonadaceae bacterium]
MTGNQIAFLVMAAVALLGAAGVVAFGANAVRAALFLVLCFFVLGFVYFSLGAQLLGITQIMVYAGAIMVLFLFVIMMLQLRGHDLSKKVGIDIKSPLAWMFGIALFAVVFQSIVLPMNMTANPAVTSDLGKPEAVGSVLFTTFSWPFEVTSLLLLIGVVGSILLAKRRI